MKNKKSTKTGREYSKVIFPNWDDVIYTYIQDNFKFENNGDSNFVKSFFDKIDKIKSIGFGNHIAETMTLAINADALQSPEIPKEEIAEIIKKSLNEINEFYSVFELTSGSFIEIDSSIEKKLGLTPELFSIPNLFALNPKVPLFHKSDVSHVIRWAGIAYAVLGLPTFKIENFNDYYKISFRIPTKFSSNETIRSKNFVTLEKKCFLFCDTPSKSLKFPKYHFDRWSIYDAESFTFVHPQFISTPEQTDKLNSLSYLMNAFLLDISPKYLLMLNQKRFSDRNKEISNKINICLEDRHGVLDYFNENQIADSFAKTIRNKVQTMSEKWDFIDEKNIITSDQQALEICNKYGLTPIPMAIEELIYNCITLE